MDYKVSVVITTCRASNKLIRAIESVLKQSYKNIEIIVVDDNGDGTKEQIETEKMLGTYLNLNNFKYIKHKTNSNGAVARNTGVKNSTGTFIAFLDDDDFFLKDRLEKFMVELKKKPDFDAAYSSVLFLRDFNIVNKLIVKEEVNLKDKLLVDQSLLGTGSNIFVKKSAYQDINGFDEEFNRYQDVEFMIRFLQKHKILKFDDFLVGKDITESRFYPKYDDFIKAQDCFLNKFKNCINKLSSEEKRKCLLSKRKELIFSAYESRNSKNIDASYRILQKSIPNVTNSELLKIKFYGNMIIYNIFLIEKIRCIKRKKRIKEIKRELSIDLIKEIEDLVM